jgi:hypothetical protein
MRLRRLEHQQNPASPKKSRFPEWLLDRWRQQSSQALDADENAMDSLQRMLRPNIVTSDREDPRQSATRMKADQQVV